ncbi:MAG TPA: serine hydrolase [Caldilineaceae bacterium]|nr:serine hydrolase [Caldilineaceae bacterium]
MRRLLVAVLLGLITFAPVQASIRAQSGATPTPSATAPGSPLATPTPVAAAGAEQPAEAGAKLVRPCPACEGHQVWVLQDGQANQVEVAAEIGLFFDYAPATDRILYGSRFPAEGAGPGHVAVSDLWVLEMDRGQTEPILPEREVVEALWAPDGQSFAYVRATEETYELRWRTLDGEDRLLAADVAFTFSVSPGGEQVAFTRESGYGVGSEPGLYVVEVASGEERRLSDTDREGNGSIDDRPVWSPDGDYLILPATGPDGDWILLLAAVDGSGDTPIEFDPALATEEWYNLTPYNLFWPETTHLIGTVLYGPGMTTGDELQTVHYRLNDSLDTIVEGSVIAEGMLVAVDRASGLAWVQAGGELQAIPLPALAQEKQTGAAALTPKAALERLLTAQTLDEAWFAAPFLAAVPPAQLEEILAQFAELLGPFERVEGEASPFTAVFANGTVPVEITLDAEGRIAGLFFRPPTLAVATLDEAVAAFEALPGKVSVLVLRDGEPLAALNADEPLAVGSAFKLAILAALQQQIEAGERAWDEVARLQPEWKAPPSSLLRAWPDGSPLTLHTLATLMISISDNTAADALLHILGRETVEAYAERNRPFLTTQELFKLKASENAPLLARYRNGNLAAQRQVLRELAAIPLSSVQGVSSRPILDVEWFFTAHELCDLMAQVEELELMTVEPGPGVADPAAWARVAYKGGSELGVLNLTTWLETEGGIEYCVVATLNRADAAIDQNEFFGLYRALVQTLPHDEEQ